MDKKLLLLFITLSVFLLTGCTARYTIEISDDKIVETMDLSETNIEKAEYVGIIGKSFKEYVETYEGDRELIANYYSYHTTSKCNSCKTYDKKTINSGDEVYI